ncbi:MAG: hypothetical protein IPI79_01770 [Moraxellaceae bacterium]|nr:hypothetical protein [Moraxellaceae bacterium]
MVWVLIGFIIVVFLGLSRQNRPIEKTKLKDIPKALELGVETLAEYSKKLEQASASLLVKTYQNSNQRNIKRNRPLDTLDQLIDRTDLPIKDIAYIIGVNLLNQESSLSKSALEQKHEALLAYISSLAEEDVLTNLELQKTLRNVITTIPTDAKHRKNIELATQERAQILAEKIAKLAEHNGILAEEKAKPDAENTIQEPLHPSVVVSNKIIDFFMYASI